MDVGRDLKNYKKVCTAQTSRVEYGQCVDIERISLFGLINNNYVELHEVAISFAVKKQLNMANFITLRKLCHRALGTGTLFLSLLVL